MKKLFTEGAIGIWMCAYLAKSQLFVYRLAFSGPVFRPFEPTRERPPIYFNFCSLLSMTDLHQEQYGPSKHKKVTSSPALSPLGGRTIILCQRTKTRIEIRGFLFVRANTLPRQNNWPLPQAHKRCTLKNCSLKVLSQFL
jgi:hypothetical protein